MGRYCFYEIRKINQPWQLNNAILASNHVICFRTRQLLLTASRRTCYFSIIAAILSINLGTTMIVGTLVARPITCKKELNIPSLSLSWPNEKLIVALNIVFFTSLSLASIFWITRNALFVKVITNSFFLLKSFYFSALEATLNRFNKPYSLQIKRFCLCPNTLLAFSLPIDQSLSGINQWKLSSLDLTFNTIWLAFSSL